MLQELMACTYVHIKLSLVDITVLISLEKLMEWITGLKNPGFAKALWNWGHSHQNKEHEWIIRLSELSI
jgi:hypothetical protein